MTKSNTTINIGLFMTLGIGLGIWKRVGSLDRELALYKELIANGCKVTIFTYDKLGAVPVLNINGLEIKTLIPPFLPNRLFWIYAFLMPLLFYKQGRKLDVLKTNQAAFGWSALLCGYVWRKKIIARCGYVFGETAETTHLTGFSVKIKCFIEKIVFKYANICFIPSLHLKDWVVDNYNIAPKKIMLMPNNVDINLFCPAEKKRQDRECKSIIAVGRLAEVKRIDLLIEALSGSDWRLTLIGTGPLKESLKEKAESEKVYVDFLGNCNNRDIPELLRKSDVYVICSLREGHPKSLIEAMACGCACIGTDSPGIRDVIINNKTGLICDSTPPELYKRISMILSDNDLRRSLGKKARTFAVKHYSLASNAEKEYNIMNAMA